MPTKTFKIGRDAKTGILVPLKKVPTNPSRYITERMPKKGYGDTR